MLLIICLWTVAAQLLYLRPGPAPGNGSSEQPFWSLAAALATPGAGPMELLILGPSPLLVVQPSDQAKFGDLLQSNLVVR